MTVADNTSRNQYTATSGQTVFAYTFEIVDKGDIVVLKNGTTLSEGTNYTVSGVGAENGGNITLTVGATAGDIMTLYRDMAYVRTQNYADSGDFLASEVNTDFDNLWLAGEQTNRSFSQSIRKPITDSDSISMELPEAADRANSFLTFDATGAPTVTSVGDPGAPSSIIRQQFTGDGTTTAFTLASAPGASGQSVQIFIDGVYQENDTYSISGTTLTFTEAPPVNASIETVRFEVNDIGETSANLVSYTPAGTGAVQTTVQTKLRESVSVKDFGAVGDGVTDDTAALGNAVDAALNAELIIPHGTYKVSSEKTYDKVKVTGNLFPTLESSVTNGSLGTLKNNVVLENVTIDGNSSTSRQFLVGDTTAGLTENIWINQNLANDAPSNLFRLTEFGSKVVISNNQTEDCKIFNTDDKWQGTSLIAYGNIVDGVTGEASLFESPAYKATWHGTVHYGNIYQMAVNGQRTVGYAGIKGFVDSSNIYRGNTGVSKDVFHIEDSSEFGVVSGNLMVANGAVAAIDCALGGDPSYVQFESASGSFTDGETITGGTSGASATVDSTTSTEVLDVSSVSGTFKAGETITGGTSGTTATVSELNPKSILLTSNTIIPGGGKGIELEGSEPQTFQKITLSNNHIENASVPIQARVTESVIMNNVMYDPEQAVKVAMSGSPNIVSGGSPTAHNVYVTNNYYVKPTFIRGDVGHCFDPNNIIFRTSFADEGAGLSFGGSVGTGGTVTYPVSVAGDGIAGVKYLRATRGSTNMTRRIDIDFDASANDIQNGDTISVQICCRSSVANRGRAVLAFPSAGPSATDYDLATTTDWQVLGITKNIPSTADLYAGGAGQVELDLYIGEDLATSGETFDIAWIKVSHVRGY